MKEKDIIKKLKCKERNKESQESNLRGNKVKHDERKKQRK